MIMAKFELKLPKMGESVAEATLTSWLKEVGDTIEEDEAVLEIATDKVDSEVPSEVTGVLVEKLFEVDDVIQVGQTIAVIEIAGKGLSQNLLLQKQKLLLLRLTKLLLQLKPLLLRWLLALYKVQILVFIHH
jgi:pyruvate/2-oxoglutarate dehydrogenase complex dihydrolipoamide acyltransferase (E2) component